MALKPEPICSFSLGGCRGLRLHPAHSVANQFQRRAKLQLLFEVAPVRVNSLRANVQLSSDAVAVLPRPDQRENLELPIGQAGNW